MKAIRLFHTTTVDRADSIMRNGFRDNATKIKRLPTTTILTAEYYYTPRVWFGDVPVLDDELFDGPLFVNNFAERQTFIAVAVRLPVRGIQSSADADAVETVNADGTIRGILHGHVVTWPGTQYWGPARIWNRFPRTRLQLDDIIRLRLAAEPALIGKIKRRFKKSSWDLTPFQARVKKILVEQGIIGGITIEDCERELELAKLTALTAALLPSFDCSQDPEEWEAEMRKATRLDVQNELRQQQEDSKPPRRKGIDVVAVRAAIDRARGQQQKR